MALAECGIKVGDSQVVIWKFSENPCVLSAVVQVPAHSCGQKTASPFPHSTSYASSCHW